MTRNILWHRTAVPGPDSAKLSHHLEADFVVVGGGLTGCRTALGLAEEGASVVLLEAECIGWGASGRSGGQCNPIWRATPDDLVQKLGDAQASRLVETTIGSADALFADIERYEIACDHRQEGWVQAAHCKSARRNLERLGEAWRKAGSDISVLEGQEVERACGSNAYNFALFHRAGGHVHPLSLTRGFANKAVEFGARLYEDSPVTKIEKTEGKWTVHAGSGSVLANQVVLTTNAYTDGVWPHLRETFYPLVSISLATEPLSHNLRESVLPGSVTIADTRRAIYYSRYDRDHRLVFGCVGSSDDAAAFGGIGRLNRGLSTVFPQLADTKIEATWAGRIAVTPDMMPRLHEPDSGVLAGLGFSGRGIAMTSVMARTLVKKALGTDDASLPFPVSKVERAPFHGLTRRMIPLAAPAMTLRDRLDTIINPDR